MQRQTLNPILCIVLISLVIGQSTKKSERKNYWKTFTGINDKNTNNIFSLPESYKNFKARDELPSSSNPTKKEKSRQITLPRGYNRLEVPKLQNVRHEVAHKYRLDADSEIGEMLNKITSDVLPIEVDVTVRKIRNLNEKHEEISAELDFSAKWLDYVILLENNNNFDASSTFDDQAFAESMKSLDSAFLKRLWKPDLFIEEALSVTRTGILTTPVRLLFSPSGFIIFSTRITVKLNCAMDFHYYPADTQICHFKIRSYSYTTNDLNITWGKPGPFFLDRADDNFHLKLDLVESIDVVESEGSLHETYQETYRVLQFNICARRQLSYHLMQTYLPSVFFIAITWLSFLVPVTMVEARIGISMTTLLTLTSMFAAVRESTPTVSYIKAIDIWMVACIFFVFLTLLELTILSCRRHLRAAAMSTDDDIDYAEPIDKIRSGELDLTKNFRSGLVQRRQSRRMPVKLDEFFLDLTDEKIEKFAFLGFFALFIVFNFVYWPWLLVSSGYFKWEVDSTYNARRN